MSFVHLQPRLSEGRPLILDADTGASFRARGVELDGPGTLGLLLREQPALVLSHHRAEVSSRVDVVCALTADTTPRALAEVGMQHRAAMLTHLAVELAFEATQEVDHNVVVASVLGSDMVGPVAADRLHEELVEHAARLRAAGSELVIARGQGSRVGLVAAVIAAASLDLPTWAVVECWPGSETERLPLSDLLLALRDAGASAVLFEVPAVDTALRNLERSRVALETIGLVPGVLLAASVSALRGFNDPTAEPEGWSERVLELSAAGARIIGGGAGTTEAHTRALALALGSLHPSVPTQRSDASVERGPDGW